MQTRVTPFLVAVDDEAIDDLRRRVRSARWPETATVPDWGQGVPLNYCRELADYWASDYDWRRCEARLNALDNFCVSLPHGGEKHQVHFIHRRSAHENATPLLITHGWPGSVLEFTEIIDALADPTAHGGEADDAFHVIAPSLPGYGFSGKPTKAGTSVEAIADLWDALMDALGYEHYVAQGGDWGSMVTSMLGLRHPGRCVGIHLNMVVALPDPDTLGDLSVAEQAALSAAEHYAKWDSGYSKQQSTRPQTLGYALADSPVGQMAWIIEKFQAWTDCERDGVRHPENAVDRDAMLDNVSLYWFTNTATSSARLYWESFNAPNLEPVNVPMGGSLFPKDIFLASERWARKRFPKLVYWNELERGGHFAALEQPRLFVEELRACFRCMR
ncbi:MAG: epoxide hydrolase [Halieaceae bacterium]|jgi:pimeloyl-ACP methyl ester carboxylesterase|nr:epoxide hydrolase [Halieaceae bacterium]